MTDEFAPWLILDDANGRERDSTRPYLIFDPTDGVIAIADDYESTNDPAMRDFILHKNDVIKLAFALMSYALHGTTSTAECLSQHDVERTIENHRKGIYT